MFSHVPLQLLRDYEGGRAELADHVALVLLDVTDRRVFLQNCVASEDFDAESAFESVFAGVSQPLMTFKRALADESLPAVTLPGVHRRIVRFLVNLDRVPIH